MVPGSPPPPARTGRGSGGPPARPPRWLWPVRAWPCCERGVENRAADVTTTVQPTPADVAAKRTPWMHLLHPAYRVALRWLFIGVLTVIAFRASLASLVEITLDGSMGGYVWAVPLAAILAADQRRAA